MRAARSGLVTRLAICGRSYTNPYALRAFVDRAHELGADRLVYLGDFGTYGAEPEPIWPLLTENGRVCVAGNYGAAADPRRPEPAADLRAPRS